MNIKEHIEAGHYPKDEKGRALVPTTSAGTTAVISATDAGPCPNFCLLGWLVSNDATMQRIGWWQQENGQSYVGHPNLLPPPPRKVKVMRYLVTRPGRWGEYGTFTNAIEANVLAHAHGAIVVPLTGEYEEPW